MERGKKIMGAFEIIRSKKILRFTRAWSIKIKTMESQRKAIYKIKIESLKIKW